ncbi:MAG: hypothetical protein Q9163_005968 [Psora crenata]
MKFHSSLCTCASQTKVGDKEITVPSGHLMGQITDMAASHNLIIEGGANPNVGLAGYLTGGGYMVPLARNVVWVLPRGNTRRNSTRSSPYIQVHFVQSASHIPREPQCYPWQTSKCCLNVIAYVHGSASTVTGIGLSPAVGYSYLYEMHGPKWVVTEDPKDQDPPMKSSIYKEDCEVFRTIYNKTRGHKTLYVCGTDEYGTATEAKAIEEKTTPSKLCEKYHKLHAAIYEWFEIDFDIFGRTSTPQQTEIAQDIFRQLYKNDYLITRESRQPYCENHRSFLADRFIEGTCPKCGYEDARGDQCDKCGSVDYEALDLINPRCKICPASTPVVRGTRHMHLKLDKLQPAIEEWFTEACEKGAWSKNGRLITESWLKDGLRERSITRDLTWGTPVPVDVFTATNDEAEIFKDKVFYVWFDACIGYVSITANYTHEWERWWREPNDVQLYHPGTQIGTGQKWVKSFHLSTTEYLNYENGKFSKSRGIGVFGDTAQKSGVAPDVWRYYLLKNRPETADAHFEWRSFIEANNSELLAKFGNFVNRVIKFVNVNYASVVPDYTTRIGDPCFDKPKAQINEHLAEYVTNLDSVNLREGLAIAMAIAQAGNNLLQSNGFNNKLVKDEVEKAAAVTGIAINLVYLLASIFGPYLPASSSSILEQLGGPPLMLIPDRWSADNLKPGHVIGKAKHLFSVIDSKKEDEWREMYGGTQAERAKKAEDAAKAALKKAAAKARKAEAKAKKAAV